MKRDATDWRVQVALIVALHVVVAAITGGPFVVAGRLSHDRAVMFSVFRDTLHAINVFGEYPWWSPSSPSTPGGFPSYYTTLLFWPGREPIFVAMAAIAWLLGRAQVTIGSYLSWYVAYFAFFVPLLLSLSALTLARQILRHPLAVYLVIVLMAFSPGVMFSMSDMGVELTAYGLFFAAAFLRLVREPSAWTFALAAAVALIMADVTYFALYWNVLFVPLFVLLVLTGARGAMQKAVRAVSPGWWAAVAVALVLCVLPNVFVSADGRDIVAARAGDRAYAYGALRPGTPLEALAASTPGVGFEWSDYQSPRAAFTARALTRDAGFMSYGYLGMMTLSLVAVGLTFGRAYWAVRLFAIIAAGTTVLLLSAYSPVFALILGWPSPFRAVDHYSDALFRAGLFTIFVLAAALGAEAVLGPSRRRRWILAILFLLNGVASIALLLWLQRGSTLDNYLFGVALALLFLYSIALVRFARARTGAEARRAFVVLLCLLLVDTSTFAFAHHRLAVAATAEPVDDPGPDTIGSPGHYHLIWDFLSLRGVDRRDPKAPVLDAHITAVTHRTYNTLSFSVNVAEPTRVEWRDAYFPSWRAWVNEREVPIERTPGGMKAVQVPAGRSVVNFRFSPTRVRVALALWMITLGAAILVFARICYRRCRISP